MFEKLYCSVIMEMCKHILNGNEYKNGDLNFYGDIRLNKSRNGTRLTFSEHYYGIVGISIVFRNEIPWDIVVPGKLAYANENLKAVENSSKQILPHVQVNKHNL